jgi:hypothetical protein
MPTDKMQGALRPLSGKETLYYNELLKGNETDKLIKGVVL